MKTFEKVYQIVSKIPKSKVLTYKKVAEIAGLNPPAGGARIVGFALNKNKNPDKIPCHRVVKSNGTLASGYAFGGPKKQKEILEKEGIKFDFKGKINFSKFLIQLSR